MSRTLIAIAASMSLALAGCEESPAEERAQEHHEEMTERMDEAAEGADEHIEEQMEAIDEAAEEAPPGLANPE